MIMEATTYGRKGKAEARIIVGNGVPFGYVLVGKKKDTRLEIDPEAAAIVRLIYHLFVHEQMSMQQIAYHLIEQNIPTPGKPDHPRQKGGPAERSYTAMWWGLSSEAYTGIFYQNRYVKTDDKRSILRPRAEWVPIQIPAIIDGDMCEEAQERITRGCSLYKKPAQHEYLSARHLRCSCGYAASGTVMRGRYRTSTYL